MAPQLYDLPCSWRTLQLSTSYRITGNMATFVNEVMLGRSQMRAAKGAGRPVQYLRGNPWRIADWVGNAIIHLIKEKGVRPDDIFVLAGSIKPKSLTSNTPLRTLENRLVLNNVVVHTPNNDESNVDDNVAAGKVTFSSFHQCKGLERRFVFVMGFDASYFEYMAKELDPKVCPCALYVAATRATEMLFLLGENNDTISSSSKPLPFLLYKRMQELARGPNPAVEFTDWEYSSFRCEWSDDLHSRLALRRLVFIRIFAHHIFCLCTVQQ